MTSTENTATATTATVGPVFVGNGRAVHLAIIEDERGALYTRCGAEGRGMRTSRLIKAEAGTAATCENCTGDKAAAATLPTEAPSTCERHNQGGYAPKTVKAGTYVGYYCGCKVWIAA